jgi:hypothetical protein
VTAWALPADSCDTIHLQQFWFQDDLAHQEAMSSTFFPTPQKQVGQLPATQFPPQESHTATTATASKKSKARIDTFIL